MQYTAFRLRDTTPDFIGLTVILQRTKIVMAALCN